MAKILVTGSAGFIGFHLAEALISMQHDVVGLDNINDYYDPKLKFARLKETGIGRDSENWYTEIQSNKYPSYKFIRLNLEDKEHLFELFKKEQFEFVVNLAAQAGVRYSITNPDAYLQSNIVGFLNILEACRHFEIKHLVYASSSSVYGLNETMPFSVQQTVDHPISLYAASKKANELMAHTYSYLYKIPTSGLRFFTVYGPWNRPDMAVFLFADAIYNNKPIKVFNHGKMKRDFTYIDDIVQGIITVLESPAKPNAKWTGTDPDPASSKAPYRLYNIGNNQPVELMHFIKEIEKQMGKPASLEMLDMQAGDVPATWANVDDLIQSFGYEPNTPIQTGIARFVDWYKKYNRLEKSNSI